MISRKLPLSLKGKENLSETLLGVPKLVTKFSVNHTWVTRLAHYQLVSMSKNKKLLPKAPSYSLLSLSGRSELAVKVPDTITEWKASAFCLSGATGLGLSPIISLQVFQPFFLELTLPYSVVRGEAFTLKATVFNYLAHCIRVRTLLWRRAKVEGRHPVTI